MVAAPASWDRVGSFLPSSRQEAGPTPAEARSARSSRNSGRRGPIRAVGRVETKGARRRPTPRFPSSDRRQIKANNPLENRSRDPPAHPARCWSWRDGAGSRARSGAGDAIRGWKRRYPPPEKAAGCNRTPANEGTKDATREPLLVPFFPARRSRPRCFDSRGIRVSDSRRRLAPCRETRNTTSPCT